MFSFYAEIGTGTTDLKTLSGFTTDVGGQRCTITIVASPSNTSYVYVGDSTVTNSTGPGVPLSAEKSYTMVNVNPHDVYVVAQTATQHIQGNIHDAI